MWISKLQNLYILRIEIPYDPKIPLLGVYMKNSKSFIHKDIYIPMFIAAFFMVAKTWKQTKCPVIEDWIKKMWFMYTIKYYSAIRELSFFNSKLLI